MLNTRCLTLFSGIMKKENSNKKNRTKVFVGLSGGVDSSVSAALLKERGYDVVGVFIKAWYPDWLSCAWKDERRDAMRVCARLGIPFLTFDFGKEYKKEVIDYMIAEYKKGRTPNPDVMCNRMIKFGAFLKRAKKMGADFVATGHYARVVNQQKSFDSSARFARPATRSLVLGESPRSRGNHADSPAEASESKAFLLHTSKDKEKDQTYFLWTLTQDDLKNIIFPIDGFKKSEVRKLAKKFGLITAEKKDSQGLCFLGKISVRDFLKKYIKEKKGKVVDENGNTVGSHNGATFITIGQRHGFEITEKGTERKPYYVVAKDIKKNLLIVSHKKEEKESFKKEVLIEKVNWISGEPDFSKKYGARIRYRQVLEKCHLEYIGKSKIKIVFNRPQRAVSSGQSLVIYDNGVCLGGGIMA
ncbi:MAG: tRNA 2-thiouridine(34) synthase MnmA [Candidatus Terrybacteria bacterium CG10_big_fil_rev_8_21_14_0_10_41_10]|uniref:tRNA-specific 2-thiouridylase MnmA n=1 Tax=Candidatus Terrybacteria bacterium CG10_big_fil_rev_8_21_14_0_10_41_10 TaxID=1975026 RepID=A0A2M8LBE6_9BACT|nr:MAG: tRNA 2-thiouridine(34) synthase MnmA [Candidatus Terrybacteria bacterium CG10_big_fil_rev_8_21_14_0_10_41_10]